MIALIAKARELQAHRDWSAAAALAAELRDRFPESTVGYQIGAAAARETRQFDEAATILAEAVARFPNQAWPREGLAWTARARGDTDESIRLAADLRSRFPENAVGYQIGAAVARETRQFGEAETILAEAVARFPNQAWPREGLASTARARGDADESIRLAAELRNRFPENAVGYRMGALFLSDLNRLAEAEAVLTSAAVHLPAQSWVAKEMAKMATLRATRAATAKLIEILRTGQDLDTFLELGKSGADRNTQLRDASASNRPRADRKVIAVLGMHRAGTSICAKIIQDLGIDLGGPLLRPNFDNPDGYQEHAGIVEHHEQLLKAMELRWDSLWLVEPPPRDFGRSEPFATLEGRLKQIVAEQLAAAAGVWAFKDPRTLRFLPLWKTIFDDLDVQPVWVLAVRDPRSVSASLLTRNRLPMDFGELLWLEHYLEALRHLGPDIAGIVHYERWFSDPRGQIRKLAAAIGVESDAAVDRAFRSIRPDLRHHTLGPHDFCLDVTSRLYRQMLDNAPDLGSLQLQSESAWQGIEAISLGISEPMNVDT